MTADRNHTPRKAFHLGWIVLGTVAPLVILTPLLLPRTNPPVESAFTASAEVQAIVERACYNCHSSETEWPWYSAVPPTAWLVVNHVKRGREHLNFSEWPTLDFELQDLYIEGIRDAVRARTMPPASYRLIHPESRLTDVERAVLLEWFAPAEEFDEWSGSSPSAGMDLGRLRSVPSRLVHDREKRLTAHESAEVLAKEQKEPVVPLL